MGPQRTPKKRTPVFLFRKNSAERDLTPPLLPNASDSASQQPKRDEATTFTTELEKRNPVDDFHIKYPWNSQGLDFSP